MAVNINLCCGNAAFRCWSWAGAFAEDQSLAWGKTYTAVRQFFVGQLSYHPQGPGTDGRHLGPLPGRTRLTLVILSAFSKPFIPLDALKEENKSLSTAFFLQGMGRRRRGAIPLWGSRWNHCPPTEVSTCERMLHQA